MIEYNISILREKFTVREKKEGKDSIIVGSNRMTLPLVDESGMLDETFIIRGKFMHEVARMGAVMITNYKKLGPFMNRQEKFDWEDAYFKVQQPYERAHFPDDWIAVYNKGKLAFQSGKHHPFLDIIEQCDVKNEDEYDFSVAMAEDAFRAAGKDVSIDHLSTIALVAHAYQDKVRCGVIDRNVTRTRTFNFTAGMKEDADDPQIPDITDAIHTAAAFLEGLQRAFKVGYFNGMLKKDMDSHGSKSHQEAQEALKIVKKLNADVTAFNTNYEVRYRPEMPEFDLVARDVEDAVLHDKL